MNQPENQSDRATAGDVEWLVRVVSSGRTGEIRNFPVAAARRILNSLRAPAGTVIEKEALARALYIYAGHESQTGAREAYWQSQSDTAEENRGFWAREAGRLLSLLPSPAPVVQQQPRAWECVGPLGSDLRCATTIRAHADELRADGWTVTPLYALQESP